MRVSLARSLAGGRCLLVSCCGEPDGDPLSARPRPPSRPQRRVPAPTAGRAAALACLHCAALPFPEAIALFSTSPRFPSSPTRSMLVAGRRMSAQCVQERQNSHPRHLPEGTTAESLRPASLAPCRPGSPFAVLPGAPPPVCCFPGRPWPVSSLPGSRPPFGEVRPAAGPEEGCGGGSAIRLSVLTYHVECIVGPRENSRSDAGRPRQRSEGGVCPLNLSCHWRGV